MYVFFTLDWLQHCVNTVNASTVPSRRYRRRRDYEYRQDNVLIYGNSHIESRPGRLRYRQDGTVASQYATVTEPINVNKCKQRLASNASFTSTRCHGLARGANGIVGVWSGILIDFN